MAGQLNKGNVVDQGLDRTKINLNFNDPDPNHFPLRAQDIPFNSTQSISDVINTSSAELIDFFDFSQVLSNASRPIFWGQTPSLRNSNGYSLSTADQLFGQSIVLTGTDVSLAYAEFDTLTIYDPAFANNSLAKDFTRFAGNNHSGSNAKLVLIAKLDNLAKMDVTDGVNIILTSDITTNGGYTYKVASYFVDTNWTYIVIDLSSPSSTGTYADLTNINTITIRSKAAVGQTLNVTIGYCGILSANSVLARKIYSNGDLRIFDPCNAIQSHTKDAGIVSDSQDAGTYLYLNTSIALNTNTTTHWEYRRTFETSIDLSGIDTIYAWLYFPATSNFSSLDLLLSNEDASYAAATNKIACNTAVQSDGNVPSGAGWKLFKFSLTSPLSVAGKFDFTTLKSLSLKLNQSAGLVANFNIGLVYGTSVTGATINNATNVITLPNTEELIDYDTNDLVGYQLRVLNPVNKSGTIKDDSVFYDITANSRDVSNVYITVEPKRVINPNYPVGNASRVDSVSTLPSIASYNNPIIEIYKDASIQQSSLPRRHAVSVPYIENNLMFYSLGLADVISGATNLIQTSLKEQYYLAFNLDSHRIATNGASIQFDYQDGNNYNSILLKSLGSNNTSVLQIIKVIDGVTYPVSVVGPASTSGGYLFGKIEILNTQDVIKIYKDKVLIATMPKIWFGGQLIIKGFQNTLVLKQFLLSSIAEMNVYSNAQYLYGMPVGQSGINYIPYVDNVGNEYISGKILVGTNASLADFPNATLIASQANTGYTDTTNNFGIIGEAVSVNLLREGFGVYGVGNSAGNKGAVGVFGEGRVSASGDTGDSIGVKGLSTRIHGSGANVGVYGEASGGSLNFSFYGVGDIYTTRQLKSGVATGTAPITVSSTTICTNLHADRVDNVHIASLTSGRLLRYNSTGTQIENATVTESSGALGGITTIGMSGRLTNTVATGTSPFIISSTTVNTNLNADLLDGYHSSNLPILNHTHSGSGSGGNSLSLGTGTIVFTDGYIQLAGTGINPPAVYISKSTISIGNSFMLSSVQLSSGGTIFATASISSNDIISAGIGFTTEGTSWVKEDSYVGQEIAKMFYVDPVSHQYGGGVTNKYNFPGIERLTARGSVNMRWGSIWGGASAFFYFPIRKNTASTVLNLNVVNDDTLRWKIIGYNNNLISSGIVGGGSNIIALNFGTTAAFDCIICFYLDNSGGGDIEFSILDAWINGFMPGLPTYRYSPYILNRFLKSSRQWTWDILGDGVI